MKEIKRIDLRLSKEEWELIEHQYKHLGYSKPQPYIKDTLIQRTSTIEKNNYRDLLYEVNKIGVNINQLSRHCNTNNELDQSVLVALIEIERHLKEIVKNKNKE